MSKFKALAWTGAIIFSALVWVAIIACVPLKLLVDCLAGLAIAALIYAMGDVIYTILKGENNANDVH